MCREALWKKHSYKTVSIEIDSEGDEDEEDIDGEDDEEKPEEDKPKRSINYVSGDVTQPVATAKSPFNIIIHCAGQFLLCLELFSIIFLRVFSFNSYLLVFLISYLISQ